MSDAEIRIRRARAEDAAQISQCLTAAFEPFRHEYTHTAFQDTVPGPDAVVERMLHMTVYVAIAQEQAVVGTIALGTSQQEGHLRGMAVLPAWQGRGVAQQLLEQAECDAIAAGCTRLTLDTTQPLLRAMRFYERNGFVRSGRVTDFLGMPLQEYVKELRFRT